MSGAQHLYRRSSGIYFVRLCVPSRLKAAVGKGEIHRTTGVRDYRLAKIVAAEMVAHWHRAIQVLERMDIKKIKAGSIDLLGDGHITLVAAAKALGSTAASLAERLFLRRAPFFVEADKWLGWAVGDIALAVDYHPDAITWVEEYVIPAERIGQMAGPQMPYSGLLSLRLPEEALDIAKATDPIGVCQFLFWPSTARGLIVDVPGKLIDVSMLLVRRMDVEALRFELAAQVTPEMLAAATTSPTGATASQGTHCVGGDDAGAGGWGGMLFSAFFEEYMKRNEDLWKPDQVRRRRDQAQVFLDLMGDLKLHEIDRKTIRDLSDKIARIPDERHNVKRRFARADATFKDLVILADEHDLPRLTLQAQQRLLDGISEIFTWAVTETLMSANPAKGLGGELAKRTGRKTTKAHEERDAFSDEDLQKIFGASWFASGTGKKTPKGVFHAYRPHYYWLPLLALYQGGRLNELSQLYLDDIKQSDDGIAYLDFNLLGEGKMDLDDADREQAGDKSLKTVNSQRVVPLHQCILDLGFLSYVEALRAAGYSRLFPELLHNSTKGYGKAAGSWFNERYLGIELEIPRNGRKTFHSFRHNFATALGQTGVAPNVRSDLMGHVRALSLAEARYDKGGDLLSRKQIIDKVEYALAPIAAFNVADGLQAIKDALRLKESHRRPQPHTSMG